jgi:hypothetical protein
MTPERLRKGGGGYGEVAIPLVSGLSLAENGRGVRGFAIRRPLPPLPRIMNRGEKR